MQHENVRDEKNILKVGVFLSIILIFLPSLSKAITILGFTPINGTYITGGRVYEFTINFSLTISNFSSIQNVGANLHFGSQEVWPENRSIYNMSCISLNETHGTCFKEVEISAAESGTKEYFYFEVWEDGNITNLGNVTNPLVIIIDRLPPMIEPLENINNTYVSSNRVISIKIYDQHAGVDFSSVRAFSIINGEPILHNISLKEDNLTWHLIVNTSRFENNSTIPLYVNASDILGNRNTTFLGEVLVDNEIPSIEIIAPKEQEEIRGIYLLNLSVNERYSGLKMASFKISWLSIDANCSKDEDKYSCIALLNTSLLSDGNYSLEAYTIDYANNTASASIEISINNKKPSILLQAPQYARGVVEINASITSRKDIVEEVLLNISNNEFRMNCSNDFSFCTYNLNTTRFSDGVYSILAYAKNKFNYSVITTSQMIIDNTPPSILFTQDFSQTYVKGNFSFLIVVVDEFELNDESVAIRMQEREIKMSCNPTLQGRKLNCGAIVDTSFLQDGKRNITFLAMDKAGNIVRKDAEINIDNLGPEILFLIIDPTYSPEPSLVNFKAEFKDKGSDVKWAKLIIRAKDRNYTLSLENRSSWIASQLFVTSGIHYVDVQASDINDNEVYHRDVGYFYIGLLPCGNGVCDEFENYCLCKNDCLPIVCESNETIDCSSGIPRCVKLYICGNGVCEIGENCSSCSLDCGKCELNESVEATSTTISTTTTLANIEKQEEGKISFEYIIEAIENNLSFLVVGIFAILIAIVIFYIIKSRKKHATIIVKLEPAKE